MIKTVLSLIFTILTIGHVFGQSKMVIGQKHTILVDIPRNWVQAQYDRLPFFIKPDKKDVSSSTYMYVYGIDYNINPKLGDWIKGNNEYVSDSYKGVKIGTLNHEFNNIRANDYLTGKYKVVTYFYPGGKSEAILVIECRNTIVTVVLSAKDKVEYTALLPSFIALSETLKVLGTTLKKE
jgi:hypothetical protein